MKRLLIILSLLALACDSDSAWDCAQTQGSVVQQEYQVATFDRILIRDGVEVILKQGSEQSVIIESGENLLPDVSVEVSNGQLILKDNNGCNLIRDYGLTKAFVTAPNITEIRNASAQAVSSLGVLSYPSLKLFSEDFNEEESGYTTGNFDLNLDVESLELTANNLSNFFLRGSAENANLRIFAGDVRIEAQELVVQDLQVFHRGTNQMYVNPQLSIVGELRGGGDVIAVNRPPVVEVTEYYTGRLIFQD